METAFAEDLADWRVETPENNDPLRQIGDLVHKATAPSMRTLGACSYRAVLYENRNIASRCGVDLIAWQFRSPHQAFEWWKSVRSQASGDIQVLSKDSFVAHTDFGRTLCLWRERFGFKAEFLTETPEEQMVLAAITSRITGQIEPL